MKSSLLAKLKAMESQKATVPVPARSGAIPPPKVSPAQKNPPNRKETGATAPKNGKGSEIIRDIVEKRSEQTPNAMTMQKTFKQSPPSPPGFFSLSCGGHRVIILRCMDAGCHDVFCFDFDLQRTMHLQRKDIQPAEDAELAIAYINNLKP